MLSQIIRHVNDTCERGKSSETKILPIAAQCPRYFAPEMVTGETSGSFSSDVWSYGILIYEVLTYGRKPFRHLQINTDVSEKLAFDCCC